MLGAAGYLTGLESGLIYTALSVFGGASVVGLRVVAGRRRGRALRPMLLIGTLALSLLLLFRAIEGGQVPLVQRFEVLVVVAWVLAIGGWLLDRRLKLGILPAIAGPTLALLTLFAILLVPDAGTGAPDARWGKLAHIILAALGFAAFGLAAGVGGLYLWQIRVMKRNPMAAARRTLPPLEVLDRVNYIAAAFGFPLLTLSMFAGWLFLADTPEKVVSWWLDPTVLTTLAGLLVYAGLFVARALLGWYGRRVAILTVVGFLVLVLGYWIASYCTSSNLLHQS